MTLAVAVPLRGGMVNLGGDGQMVIGGLVGAISRLYSFRLPGARRDRSRLLAAGSAAASMRRSPPGAR